MIKRIIFNLYLLFPLISFTQTEGTWHTAFQLAGMSNRMDLNVDTGKIQISITLPDYPDKKPVTASETYISSDSIHFKWTAINLSYSGKYISRGDSIHGKMQQNGLSWNVTFHRQEQTKISIKRPQTPVPPFPYTTHDLLIPHKELVLGATLTLPADTSQNFPIVVLASGSGAQDRNCSIMGHQPFWVIADYLARNGIACLRFDDRGIDSSTGNFQQASLWDFASDINTCVKYLHKNYKPHPIGIAGHSEGGMHALMTAVDNKQVQFLIELASVGTSGKEVLTEQQYLIPKKNGASEEEANWNRQLYAKLCEILEQATDKNRLDQLLAAEEELYAKAPESVRQTTSLIQLEMNINLMLNNAWGKEFVSYKAADYLKKLKIPVLAINGSQDIQVPPVSNSQGFEQNLSKKSIPESKVVIVYGLNHLLQHCVTCTILEYGEIEETFDPEVLKMMVDWIHSLSIVKQKAR